MPINANVVVQDKKDGPLEIREIRIPDPTGHQVVVRILATGLCQSQIFWMHQPRANPVLFGHEGYGVVARVGDSVKGLREGDPVLVTWLPRVDGAGRPAEISTLDVGGDATARAPNVYTWADYSLVDELYVRKLSGRHSDVTSIIGCAVITGAGAVINAGAVRPEESVTVFGAGGVGLCAVSAARISGSARVVAVDIVDSKLELARRFGASDVVNSKRTDPVEAIHGMLPGHGGCCSGTDVAIDCVGHTQTTDQAYRSLRDGRVGIERGGRCVVVGVAKSKYELDAYDLMLRSKTIMGSVAGSCRQEQMDDFLGWYQDGLLDLDALITDRFDFADIAKGAARLERGEIDGRALALI